MHLTLLSITLLHSLSLIAAHADCTFDPPAGQQTGTHKSNNSSDKSVMIEALKAIAPRSAQDPCIDNREAMGECRSAAQAAEPILNSFKKYKIESPAEKAALLSLMAFETGDFAYRKNHYPGRPGQGTRNMQMPQSNGAYAESLDEIKNDLAKAKGDVAAVLDLLLKSEDHDFGSAAWFLTTQCTPEVRKRLESGSQEGWEEYLTGCVHTTVTPQRKGYWERAKKEMKV
ncbi:hypothetical protein EMCG_04718 [[Emmonsia] crescens]|uniref:Uncharacterized protein n=1 Tax=[Emmonsia] crescens TaxID=73230 RepID=A0A0G2HR73_9EURO|nr:hypothetical protein EMCG_04718 [Emmonsia crescens UAMH 3008]